jgi:hypothetical protein
MSKKPTYWRIQQADDPISNDWRSQIGHSEDDLGYENGTSCCKSFKSLQKWALGGHANWLGDVAIVEFEGNLVGFGTDGEPVVRPTREINRWIFQGGKGDQAVSVLLQKMVLRASTG